MQLSRCSQGICAIILLLVASAFLLDDLASLFTTGVLVFGLLGQYLLFDKSEREIIRSVEVRRSLGRKTIRRGSSLQVISQVTFRGSPRMHVRITDLLPKNTILADGETTESTLPDPGQRTCSFRYRMIPLTHGTLSFSGVRVECRNLFFEDSLSLAHPAYTQPAITVMPSGLFQVPASESMEGTRDNRKASVYSSFDIHSLREYQPGDDLRHVDWKVSAKYNRIFLRRYSSPLSHPPLIIVDLPWSGAPVPEKEFSRMISEVTGLVNHTLQTYQRISILFISGPNVLHLIHDEKNAARCIAELREWMHPAERLTHFYHMADRTDLRSRVRRYEEARDDAPDTIRSPFFDAMHDHYLSVLGHQRNPAFSGQIARTVSPIVTTEAFLFTLWTGDISHIRHVVRPLTTQQIRVHVKIIDDSRPERSVPQGKPAPAGGKR